jgi:antitoxin HicB
MTKRQKRLEKIHYYMSLPYSILLIPEEDGGWFAKVPELRGCMTYGDTQAEVLELIEDAKYTWLMNSLKHGDLIPEPQPITEQPPL